MRPENVVARSGSVKDEQLIGHVLLEGGAHAAVLVDGVGTPVLRLNGTRYPMRRPNAVELSKILRAAAETHPPPRPPRDASR